MPTATDVAPVVPSSRLRTTRRSATLSCRFPGPVQAAGRVALEVERDELVAGRPQGLDDLFAFRDQARDLVRLHLDSRYVAVMANAYLLEPERFDGGLGRFDLTQHFDRDLCAVRDARRQAGKRRFVPVGESELARRGADLRLAHSGLEQWETNPASDGRAVTRSVVDFVVGGSAICDEIETQVPADGLQGFEQLLLAVEAAIRMGARVRLPLDSIGGNFDQPRATPPCDDARVPL